MFDAGTLPPELEEAAVTYGSLAGAAGVITPAWVHTLTFRKMQEGIQPAREKLAAFLLTHCNAANPSHLKGYPFDWSSMAAAVHSSLGVREYVLSVCDATLFAGTLGTSHLVEKSCLPRLRGTYPAQKGPRGRKEPQPPAVEYESLYRQSPIDWVLESVRLDTPVACPSDVVRGPNGKRCPFRGAVRTMPPGSLLEPNIHHANVDSGEWGSDALEFKPGRPRDRHISWNGPFGGSAPRHCPGEQLSVFVVKVMLDAWLERRANPREWQRADTGAPDSATQSSQRARAATSRGKQRSGSLAKLRPLLLLIISMATLYIARISYMTELTVHILSACAVFTALATRYLYRNKSLSVAHFIPMFFLFTPVASLRTALAAFFNEHTPQVCSVCTAMATVLAARYGTPWPALWMSAVVWLTHHFQGVITVRDYVFTITVYGMLTWWRSEFTQDQQQFSNVELFCMCAAAELTVALAWSRLSASSRHRALQRAECLLFEASLPTIHFEQSVTSGLGTVRLPCTGASSDAPTLVLVHGYGSSNIAWLPVLSGLVAGGRFRQIYLLELPGCGRSGRLPRRFHDPAEVEAHVVLAFERWRQEVGLDTIVLCGHSLGGYLCAAYAAAHPRHVRELILVSAVGLVAPPSKWEEGADMLRAVLGPSFTLFKRVWPVYNRDPLLSALRFFTPLLHTFVRIGGLLGLTLSVAGPLQVYATLLKANDACPGLLVEYAKQLLRSIQAYETTYRPLLLHFGAYSWLPLSSRLGVAEALAGMNVRAVYGDADWCVWYENGWRSAGGEPRLPKEAAFCHVEVERLRGATHQVFLDQPGAFAVLLNKAPRDDGPSGQLRQIVVQNLTFDIRSAGPVDGVLVLLLHGFPETAIMWEHQLHALASAGFRAVAPNQRGYSPGARPLDVAEYHMCKLCEDVLQMADALGASQFHLVGHDWGGAVAWQIAARSPDRVLTLSVLSTPHPAALANALNAPSSDQRQASEYINTILRSDTQNGTTDLGQLLIGSFKGVPKAHVDEYLALLSRPGAFQAASNWYRANRFLTDMRSEWEAVPAVTVPTLYIWGVDDSAFRKEAAELSHNFVNAYYRFEAIGNNVGHFIAEEAADTTSDSLLQHFQCVNATAFDSTRAEFTPTAAQRSCSAATTSGSTRSNLATTSKRCVQSITPDTAPSGKGVKPTLLVLHGEAADGVVMRTILEASGWLSLLTAAGLEVEFMDAPHAVPARPELFPSLAQAGMYHQTRSYYGWGLNEEDNAQRLVLTSASIDHIETRIAQLDRALVPCGICGISNGALVAAVVAARSAESVRFLINLCGTPWEDLPHALRSGAKPIAVPALW